MSQPLDPSLFPDLPPEVVKAFEAARFELSVERAARLHEQAVGAEKDAFITELKELIGKLEGQIAQYRHAKFGPKSEKLDPAQLTDIEGLEVKAVETIVEIARTVSETCPSRAPEHDHRQSPASKGNPAAGKKRRHEPPGRSAPRQRAPRFPDLH